MKKYCNVPFMVKRKSELGMRCCFQAAIVVLIVASSGYGQTAEDIVKWSAKETSGRAVKPGQKAEVELTAEIEDGWHVYALSQLPGGPTAMTVKIPADQPLRLLGSVTSTKPDTKFDPNFKMNTDFHEQSVQVHVPLLVQGAAPAGTLNARIDVRFQTCNETSCLPPVTAHLVTPLNIALVQPKAGKQPAKQPAAITLPAIPNGPGAERTIDGSSPTASAAERAKTVPSEALVAVGAPLSSPHQQNLRSFLWLAAVMGALSLLTPCVFPMIPITVSYFTNHSGGSRKSAVFAASVYAVGIILTFTAFGMLLAIIFGAGGVNQLAANPWVNLLITAIFFGFAFSLFGAYFIQMPSALMSRMSSITRTKEGSQIVGALLMGFTFTLTSFTCTAPFVGTLLVMTAQGNWRWPLVGMLVFATVFAIPFFILALAPQLMSQLPKAGGWMNSVKVVMGFLEIAAAMKFLSNADLVWRWGIFTRQAVLAVWVGIGILTVLYVLGYFRLSHDSPVESVGAVRLTVAVVFLATTIWLVPGLFGRQLGELESFLPPELSPALSSPGSSPASAANLHTEAGWIMNDYEDALATAKQGNQLVFIDFTGYTCTNCRWMEANMFPRPEVATEMGKFVRVRLYTDGSGEVFERQQKLQQDKFGTVALPLYAIVKADGAIVTTFPGLTRNADEFLAFLKKGAA